MLASFSLKAQHSIDAKVIVNTANHSLQIEEKIVFKNTSEIAISEVYLNDWSNAFSSKNTLLAKRFAENFKRSFHFEKSENRGKTTVHSIATENSTPYVWSRGDEVDIIKVSLLAPLSPNQSTTIFLNYTVKLPGDKFTRYGVTRNGDYKLKYWLITPTVITDVGEWKTYSHKNTDDYFQLPTLLNISFDHPEGYTLTTDLSKISEEKTNGRISAVYHGENRRQSTFYLEKDSTFESVVTDQVEVITNLKDRKVDAINKALITDRITGYLNDRLGPYPFEKIVVSETDYRSSPVYGLNQLPDFVSPFPQGFELDMELLKTTTRKYLSNTLTIDPRKDHWLLGALQIYLMIDYVDTYYPDMKILGSYSNFWIIQWSHAADLEFNDQYPLLYLNMARANLHQSLATPKDSLVKFNKNIASDYYAGSGLKYLSDYLGVENLNTAISQFYLEGQKELSTPDLFRRKLEEQTDEPIDWFFDEYVGKRTTIDFKIKKVKKAGDSLEVTVINKKDNKMPVSIYGINKDQVLFKKWLNPIDSATTITVPRADVKKLVLNYEGNIPEYNRRNNYNNVKGLLNRPVKFRLFQDIEDPAFNQLFFMPEFQYNLYDGFSIGPKLYNKTFLPKGIHYKLTPQYGFGSKTLIGKGSISYNERVDQGKLYSTRYGISGSYFSYNTDLFYKRLTPFMTFAFRDNKDLRSNKKEFINIRNVNVFRDEDPNDPDQEPNYSVFDAAYVYTDNNLINYYRAVVDYQISQKFSRISTQLEYRKLFNNNRQLDLRFYAGLFVFNDTGKDSDFFSFALDRPGDYLFDYNYYGRSEETGLFSQQIIVAEGGFKSKLEPAFANQFITTLNASTRVWKWIYLYGDVGLVKNKGESFKGVYDSGIRANLVADYFELYFPLYSNLGWEPGQPNYDEKIRFIVTLDIKTLLGLFTREWY